ncbi:Zinc finger BED domain-containing protein DAYSLEEPER [Glycine max]|nr:Zinc finger BED domain-containing protein DAYSLEEPER [Glycine max]
MDDHDVINILASSTTREMLPPCIVGPKCQHYGALIKYSSGTTATHTYLDRCKKKSNITSKRKKSISSSTTITLSSSSMIDQEACRIALVKLFVALELFFHTVEHEAFREFFSIVAPFSCCHLMHYFGTICSQPLGVCLTTDTWTLSQNLTYMSLTTHFIDNDWMLQKKVINFCQVKVTQARIWLGWLRANVLESFGFKEDILAICRVHAAIKCVKSSPSRLSKFNECVAHVNIEYKGLVHLDVETR